MGLISYFKNKYYNNRFCKAEKLFGESKDKDAEMILLSIVDKHPMAASRLAAYYAFLATKADVPGIIDLLRKTVGLSQRGGSVYDKQSYQNEFIYFADHIKDLATKYFAAESYQDCCSLLAALNNTVAKTGKTLELCAESHLNITIHSINVTKSADSSFEVLLNDFKNDWETVKSSKRAKTTSVALCDKLESSRRFYASNEILATIYADSKLPRILDNTVKIVSGQDIEATAAQIKTTVDRYGKNAVLQKGVPSEVAVSVFQNCWSVSNNSTFVIDILESTEDNALRDSFVKYIILHHSSYLSDSALFHAFAKWIYEKVEAPASIRLLEQIHAAGYNVERFYIERVHSWISSLSLDDRVVQLNQSEAIFPDSTVIIADKLECAYVYLNAHKNEKALAVADSIISKCERARAVKSHAICDIAGSESDLDKKVSLYKEAYGVLGDRTDEEFEEIRNYIRVCLMAVAQTYYGSNRKDDAYNILHLLAGQKYLKGLETIAEYRLSEVKACSDAIERQNLARNAISEISAYKIGSINSCGIYQSLWGEYIDSSVTIWNSVDDSQTIANLEKISKKIVDAGFSASASKALQTKIKKELIRRKYLVARERELSNNLDSAASLYKEIYALEAKNTPTLSALRFILCKLKGSDSSDVIQHKETIYSLLKNAASAFNAEKKDIAYRFALILLKSGEDKEALAVVNEFVPNEERLRKACEQGDVIKANAKLDDFNKKLDAAKNKTLSSKDAVYFINHMLEYAEAIKPVLQISRPTLSKYRNKLKNYAIFKLFDEGKYDVAFEKMIKEHPDYLEDMTALRNIAITCLNMAEEGQIKESNYEEVIAVWLTAIYQERLFVKSLDYTSWDDNFTFSLLGAYGHFDEDSIGALPDNVNFDDTDEDTVVLIKDVQRALLDRFEASLSEKQTYHDFFTAQKDAMDAFIALNLDVKCRLVAPYLAKKNDDLFEEISEALEQDRRQEYDNWEDVISVGTLYQMKDSIYSDYNYAKRCFQECIDAINSRSVTGARTAFANGRISLLRNFDKKYKSLLSTLSSKVAALSAKDKTEFKNNFNFYIIACNVIKDSTLSFAFSKYVMSYVVGEVNDKNMKMSEAADYILSAYLLDTANIQVRDNLTTLFEMLVRENSQDSVRAVNGILSKVQPVDSAFYRKLSNEHEQAKVDVELNEIVDKVNGNRIRKFEALEKIYTMYSNKPNNARICENLAQLCDICIMEYVVGQEYGKSSVVKNLNALQANKSSEFRRHVAVFKRSYDSIWKQLPFETQMLLTGNGFLAQGKTLNDKGLALKQGLEFYKSLGEFSDEPFRIFR